MNIYQLFCSLFPILFLDSHLAKDDSLLLVIFILTTRCCQLTLIRVYAWTVWWTLFWNWWLWFCCYKLFPSMKLKKAFLTVQITDTAQETSFIFFSRSKTNTNLETTRVFVWPAEVTLFYGSSSFAFSKKADLGHMLVQDQILSGHAYGFCSAESREIYIYVAVQQHDVQMIQWRPAHRPVNCGYSIIDYTTCSFRSIQVHSASSWLPHIAEVWPNLQWS